MSDHTTGPPTDVKPVKAGGLARGGPAVTSATVHTQKEFIGPEPPGLRAAGDLLSVTGVSTSVAALAVRPDAGLTDLLEVALAWLAAGAWPVLLYPPGWRLRD